MPVVSPLADALRERYVLERELGRGGMATVFLAHDLKHDRRVALKVLHPELADAIGAERFLREIRTSARLDHPNIVSVFDSGQAAGLLWYTMPYVEGESLRERLSREGQLTIEEAVRLTREVADALDCAHQHGIVHRDVKPENILISGGHARLADFGLTTAVESAGAGRLTKTGITVGTPTHMSPEQAGAEQVDGRSDQYSLGCVLYEMLAGEPPYSGPTAQVMVAKHIGASIPSVRTVKPDVPPELDAAISRALAKAPAARFPSTGAFSRALDGASSIRRPRRRALAVVLALVLVLATLVGIGFRDRALRGPSAADRPDRRSVAVLPFTNLSRDPDNEYFSDGITEDIASQLARIRDLKVIAHTSALQYKGRADPPRAIGAALGVANLLQGSVRRAGNRVLVTARLVDAASGQQLWADEYDRQLEDVFGIQRDVAARIVSSLRSALSADERTLLEREPTRDTEAYNLYLIGRHHFARYTPSGWRRSIEYFAQAIARDPDFALAHARLAEAYVLLGYLAVLRPEDAFPQARAAARQAVALDSTLGDAYASLGLLTAAYDRRWKEAETLFRRALALNPNSVYAHMWYATFLLTPLSRHDEAISEMQRAKALDPVSLPVRFNTAFRYYFARRYSEAIAECRQALEMDPSFTPLHAVLGFSYAALGQHQDAAREIRAALPDTVVTGSAVLGYVYALAGRVAEARSILRAVEERAKHAYVVPLDFSLIYAALGERDEAFRWLRKAYEERTPLLVFINVAAWYDTVRDDPRFTALVRDLGVSN
jgi:TolB-like protein/tRNA A-37 threonylcarbamoyl transferase component Bud32/Tfp pilus assembly protein PilF